MAEFRRHATVDRPRQDVWEFMTDPSKATAWFPNLKSLEVITDGPLGVGTKYRETRVFKKKDAVAEIEITVWEPPVVYAAGLPFGGAFFEYRYELSSPTEDSTFIEMIGSSRPKGVLGKLASIPMLKMMQKIDGDQLDRMKAAIEGGEQAQR